MSMPDDRDIECQCRENLRQLRRERTRLSRVGAIVFWAALIFLVIDLRTDFPTSLRGQFFVESLAAMGIGAFLYVRAHRLPIKEALQIARLNRGVVTVGVLAAELNEEPDEALATLARIEKQGHATSLLEGGSRVWIIHDLIVAALIPAMNAAAANRSHEQITVQDLANALHLDLNQARAVLEELKKRGHATSYPLLDTIVYDVPQSPKVLHEG
jgi:hypothetical protein